MSSNQLDRNIARFEKFAQDMTLSADMRLVYSNHLQDLYKQREAARKPLPGSDDDDEK